MSLTAKTRIVDLHKHQLANLSFSASKKLAEAAAAYAGKSALEDAVVEDLLSYYPMRYEDRSNLIKIDELYNGLEASIELFVRVAGGYQVGKNRGRKAPPLFIFEVTASDFERKQKPVVVWWFISGKSATHIVKYWERRFARGTRFIAYGCWEWDVRRNTFVLKLAKPDELEILHDENSGIDKTDVSEDKPPNISEDELLDEDVESTELSAVHVGRCVPIYRKLGQFQTKKLREITYSLLEHVEKGSFVDIIPEEIISRRSLCRYFEALRQMHFPSESSNMNLYEVFRSPAQMRLIYEEFFWMALLYGFKKSERNREEKLVKIEISNQTLARVKKVLPFTLTGAQRSVFKQISADMRSDIPMNRLVQGDVGSGKTIIAFLAMYLAIENGYQAALMAPTEILAEQHFANAKEFFGKLNLETDILTGSLRVGEKRKVKARIASGASNAIIGTHALIQDDVNFCALGLAVIDEQHRFGVLQRAQLRESGLNPEVIVMTATPIPRSLAISVYGDLDYSVIDELPPGRTPVKTVVVGEDKRTGVYKGISREVATGRQVYIVYPLIKESEKMDLKAATEMYDDLRTQIFPELRIALLHGKLKAEEKEDIMRRFTRGEVDILVSTTVIEVGVDVPNATLMVIEHAERFGLSQLHQLRGRVGRGSEESFCVLLTADKKSETARQRLGIMEKTSNGFEVAEKDLEIRGQGELLGTRQSGKRAFKLANIVRDKQILEEVQEDVTNMFKESGKSEEVEQLLRIVECDPRMNFLDFA